MIPYPTLKTSSKTTTQVWEVPQLEKTPPTALIILLLQNPYFINEKHCLAPFIEEPLYELSSHFYWRILIPSTMTFQKSQPPFK